jgi:hypothetical protein
MRLNRFEGWTMSVARFAATIAVFTFTAACATEPIAAPTPANSAIGASHQVALLPLLYVVDGVRLPRDQVPALEASQVAKVEVLKGRAALQRFGPDASYGVILITTRRPEAIQ